MPGAYHLSGLNRKGKSRLINIGFGPSNAQDYHRSTARRAAPRSAGLILGHCAGLRPYHSARALHPGAARYCPPRRITWLENRDPPLPPGSGCRPDRRVPGRALPGLPSKPSPGPIGSTSRPRIAVNRARWATHRQTATGSAGRTKLFRPASGQSRAIASTWNAPTVAGQRLFRFRRGPMGSPLAGVLPTSRSTAEDQATIGHGQRRLIPPNGKHPSTSRSAKKQNRGVWRSFRGRGIEAAALRTSCAAFRRARPFPLNRCPHAVKGQAVTATATSSMPRLGLASTELNTGAPRTEHSPGFASAATSWHGQPQALHDERADDGGVAEVRFSYFRGGQIVSRAVLF